MRDFIENTLRESGDLVKASFGDIIPSQKKMEKSQIVTEVDVASERLIIEGITKAYPQSGIIAEESGFIPSKDDTYFVIDPIDGTSNFASGLPWFGVMIAYVKKTTVVTSGIYLPLTDEMYLAEKGSGAYKNGKKIKNLREIKLSESLVSFCFASEDSDSARKEASIVAKLIPKILNLRTTNSAYDYAYAAEGKLAGTINFRNKIWDIASVILLAQETGCVVSDGEGKPHTLSLLEASYKQNYTLFIANPSVSDEIFSTIV